MAVVVDLDRAVEPGDRLEPPFAAVVGPRPSPPAVARGAGPPASPWIVYASRPVRPSDDARLAGQELERQDAHPDEVRAVDPLVALGQDGPHARAALGPLAAQSRDEPEPYSRPAITSSGVPSDA